MKRIPANKKEKVSERSIYNYIDAGELTISNLKSNVTSSITDREELMKILKV